ncbi:MAG TPA: nuclear transport factor 2 family protein [Pyrinomonadaceae bacterium]|jgi:ketosteroid isomerase-like protein|nr:nuclear transport factor 2 family protein [Pyrinomonadaceae bacterium]
MTTDNNQLTDEARIRELIEERVGAIRAGDVDSLMSNHAPEVVMFDALDPLRYVGSEAVGERAGQWLSWYQGPVGYEVRDLIVTAGCEAAFCHYLYRVSGTMTNGREVDMWVRSTVCFRKTGGAWVVAHEHTSVPFDAESGRASVDLKP